MTIRTAHYLNRTIDPNRRRAYVPRTPAAIAARPFAADYSYATYSRRRGVTVRYIPSVLPPLVATEATA